MSYYSYDEIDAIEAIYNLIIGERSNGKTFGGMRKVVDAYIDEDLPSAYIRRLDEELKPKNIKSLLDPQIEYLNQKTKGRWNGFTYYANCFFLCRYEEHPSGKRVLREKDTKPILRTYAINTWENNKGADNGAVKYIFFDEFITRRYYLPNEWVHFQNLLSSIIRRREGIKIYMLANTVNKYCPYFKEMGVKDVKDQEQGTIAVYKIGQTDKKIAVEYCANIEDAQKKNVSEYFAFENPQLATITSGAWEVAQYRHPPDDMSDYKIIFCFFILFSEELIQGDIYLYKGYPIIVFHPKTTELQHPEKDLIYQEDVYDGNPLHQAALAVGKTRAHKLIRELISTNRTFFDSNSTGELFNNWLKFASKNTLIKG